MYWFIEFEASANTISTSFHLFLHQTDTSAKKKFAPKRAGKVQNDYGTRLVALKLKNKFMIEKTHVASN